MKQSRSLRHNATMRSVASPSSSPRHQQSASGAADKSYDAVLSKAAAKHAFELSIASSSMNDNGLAQGGLNRASSTTSGERQRSTLTRGLSTRSGWHRRSVQSQSGLTRSKTVGPSTTSVRIRGGEECNSCRTTVDDLTLSRSASVGTNGFVRARSVQSLRSGGIARSETLASRCSAVSLGSTPTATRKKSFLRGGDEFAEVEYRNNPRLIKKREKKLAAEVKKAEKVEKRDTTESDRGSNAFIKGFKKMFNFASSNAKNVGSARQLTDEDDRGTYTVLTTTSQFTSPRRNIGSHTQIPPQQVSSRQAYYGPISYVGYPLSRRTSFAQSMRRVHVDDAEAAGFEVTMPALGILKDKTNSNIPDTSMTSRMSSYTSTDPFLSTVARETIPEPPLQPTQPLRTKSGLLRKPLPRQVTPNRVYSAIMRRIQNQDTDTGSRYVPVTAETPPTIMRQEEQIVPRHSPVTRSSLTDLTRDQVAARQLSNQSSGMPFNFSDCSQGLRKEPTALSTIRIVDTESHAPAPSVYEHQNSPTMATENFNSPSPAARSDRLSMFFSTSNTGSATVAATLATEPNTPLAVTPQSTGNTAASWASANPFRTYTRPQEISSLFPYYGVTTRATSTTTSETTFSRFRSWQHGNVPDSPQALHTNPSEDTVIFRGGTASISHSGAATDGRAGENEQGARLVERTLRDSISDAVDMQFGAAW
ncbi:hypothetical protein V1525DRAFT_392444 [Lipomyces kononenkoae]|uniref:Uncharacterized protein n=1 Tax=Lipomyces kononenkoae TaxID=34357 RepID=A0ACC3TBB4_LIPKO